jgi:hypothetical protein
MKTITLRCHPADDREPQAKRPGWHVALVMEGGVPVPIDVRPTGLPHAWFVTSWTPFDGTRR